MALPFKLASSQGVWFLGSLGAVVAGALHFVSVPLSIVLAHLFPAHAVRIAGFVRMLYLQTYASIAVSYIATLVACSKSWWEQAKRSSSKWMFFASFLFLSDPMHYIMYCSIFIMATNELYRCSLYFPPFVYALLNVLPVLIANVPMPDGVRSKLSNLASQQDRVYQYAVQFEAFVPVVMLFLFLRTHSPKLLTSVLVYVFVFLRSRYMVNYATHGLFSSLSNSIRQTLANVPILLKVYSFVIGMVSRGMPDGVITPNMLVESIQRPQQTN